MRRGFTLVEILVALVIMSLVVSGVLAVFQYQNRNASVQRQIGEMNLMAKGLSEELSRTLRMAGGALPPSFGGLKVFATGPERVVVALNRGNGWDTTRQAGVFCKGVVTAPWGAVYRDAYVLPLKHVQSLFPDSGYILTTVTIPGFGATGPGGATRDTMLVLPVLKTVPDATPWTVAGTTLDGPFLIADGSWFAANWSFPGCATTSVNIPVYAMDSVRYWVSGDTVFRKIDRNASAPFAVGVDSLRIWYMHPSAGWLDSLSAADPANQVVRARIRLRERTRKPDPVLRRSAPSTGGFHFQTIESEVSLRNASTLVNR